jgi:hypothetical protein
MTDNVKVNQTTSLSGNMFLYEKPELLTPKDHGSMGFTPAERPFEFVKGVRAIPLTMVEIGSAQRHYPVIFSNLTNPVPLAIVGIIEDVNLFVDDEGQWDPMCYVPTYLRCYPFTFAVEKSGQMAVVVDRNAVSVSETPQFPFFVDGEVSEHTDALMQLCTQYEAERQRTQQFCKKLVELELLTMLSAMYTPEGGTEPQSMADYAGIDAQKLQDLPAEVVHELHQVGFLSASYLHLYSLENWRHLMARRVARG